MKFTIQHVVFRTYRYDEMIAWYTTVFEGRVVQKNEKLAFLTFDEMHHRVAIANLGLSTTDPIPSTSPELPGVVHVAYSLESLGDFVNHYRRLKGHGILPNRSTRHGITLSLYYPDPDSNFVEFYLDVLSPEEALAFILTDEFAKNPSGDLFEPDELVARFEADEPVDDLLYRPCQQEAARRHVTRRTPSLVG